VKEKIFLQKPMLLDTLQVFSRFTRMRTLIVRVLQAGGIVLNGGVTTEVKVGDL